MAIAKRIFLFVMVNILIIATISIVLGLLGIPLGGHYGAVSLDYSSLAIMCLVYGMVASFISLAISRWMAKFMMGVKVVDPQTHDPDMRWLVDTVYRMSRSAGLPKMPEVGYYESDEVNAFATGPTKSRALVAVSTGLMRRMNRDQVEGVLGHEVAHIANGDMVTMTLIQGIVNAFVMFLARIVAFALSQNVAEENRPMVRFVSTIILEILIGFFGIMVVAYFSRWREFRADSGGARLAGREKMINALAGLQKNVALANPDGEPAMAALKISGKQGGLMALLSTHPPLAERIARLQRAG